MTLARLPDAAAAVAWLRRGAARGLCTDSRRVRAGEAFFAWAGGRHDARTRVGDALAAGAACALVEADGAEAFAFDDVRIAGVPQLKTRAGAIADAWYGEPSRALDVIAVTGTNGKTSAAWWTAQALGALGRRCGVVGTLGVGEPPGAAGAGAIEDTGLTTPDAVMLQAALARFVADGFAACAMEASSIGLVDHRLAGTRIAVAQFTNLTRDHLDYHGDMAAYWAAKRTLFAWPGLRAAVVNVDDEHGAALADELARSGSPVLWTTSLHGPARLCARNLQHAADGLAFDVVEGDTTLPVRCGVIGTYNVANLLAVIGALRALGISLADAVRTVPALSSVPGRMQRVASHGAALPLVVVDYAHTPDALDQALQALRPLAQARGGRLWCVFGCGGNRDATKRPLMGAIAHQRADHVVLTSDNPRDESASLILSQILAGMGDDRSVDVIEERGAAIHEAIERAAAPDVVLIAGKGHEQTQEVAGVKRPFGDVAVAELALAGRRGGFGTLA
ncbi:MAG: UDP-N-acetylmuramoyl-L-alanyl-D-glutamate--2,6-diaminopimelate ligase [Ideonella sp.]|nr:UDP-N-acetylmuramoyl-L-alanyl-D-glutamate--2,6-diaminopimelate ligase [Ideonella sp.]MCC7456376.1 UDP-N-acetylmuramoyl-L-alanyl-D-glutamate--2,6-diaminopimelate ligase [Nitrospira sp.]